MASNAFKKIMEIRGWSPRPMELGDPAKVEDRVEVAARVLTHPHSEEGRKSRAAGEVISRWKKVKDVEEEPYFDIKKMEKAGRLMLEAMGEDCSRDGLRETPKRFAKYYSQIMNGNFLDPKDCVTEFDNDGGYDGAVVVKDLPFYTICEHHLAPFIGTWDVAYKPGSKIVGLSKLVRIARVFQKRPQVQERLTKQISDTINELLEPEWVVVRMNAEHFCMSTRGVRTPGAITETLSGYGDYPKDIFSA